MDLSALEIFIAVMRRGSFAAVARDLDLDPSAVSRAVAALEEELSVRLFQRTTRRLAPTEAGRLYFARVEPLVEELARAGALAGDAGAEPRGTLRVTTSVSFGQRCVVPAIPAFAAAHPELGLELLLSDAVIDLVAERFDLAIRLGRLADSTMVATPLLRTRYQVCASPEYLARHPPIGEPPDLASHSCLLLSLPAFRSRWLFRKGEGAAVTEVAVSGRITLSAPAAILQCAIAGMGPALLPDWLTAADRRRGRLVAPLAEWEAAGTDFETAAWLVYPSRVYVPHKVRIFAEFLRRQFRDDPPWLR